ncbi:MAG: HlyD family type I secretion periplasmic adaptor subunit, partial [Gammaproteobacteria bacterium]|nr:HlyD family type I secretion periplasmic adaptor subunit [Gammaproteobacteria bacterium]
MSIFQAKEFKNLSEEDKKYLSDINAAVLFGVPVRYHFLSVIIISFILIAIYWANRAMLDEVTRGTGKIVPTIQVQTV